MFDHSYCSLMFSHAGGFLFFYALVEVKCAYSEPQWAKVSVAFILHDGFCLPWSTSSFIIMLNNCHKQNYGPWNIFEAFVL